MKFIKKSLLLKLLILLSSSNSYSFDNNIYNNNQYNFIEEQNIKYLQPLSEDSELETDNQKFDDYCILEDEEYKELNKALKSVSMPFQFINSFTMTVYILDWIKTNCNITENKIEHYSKFLYTICNHAIKLSDLLNNPNNTNRKCYKPLSNIVISLIKNFELFYNNMLNHIWTRVTLSDRNFDKYTKNIKINENLLERVYDKSIDEVLKYYEEQYAEYYNYFKYIL